MCNLSLPRALSHIQKGLFLYFHPSLDGERECVAASASLICSRSRHAVNLFFFSLPLCQGLPRLAHTTVPVGVCADGEQQKSTEAF